MYASPPARKECRAGGDSSEDDPYRYSSSMLYSLPVFREASGRLPRHSYRSPHPVHILSILSIHGPMMQLIRSLASPAPGKRHPCRIRGLNCGEKEPHLTTTSFFKGNGEAAGKCLTAHTHPLTFPHSHSQSRCRWLVPGFPGAALHYYTLHIL